MVSVGCLSHAGGVATQGHMGWTAGCEYAEAFVRARAETLPMISVAAADLRKSVESPQVRWNMRASQASSRTRLLSCECCVTRV